MLDEFHFDENDVRGAYDVYAVSHLLPAPVSFVHYY
jgi:hypothetical protein